MIKVFNNGDYLGLYVQGLLELRTNACMSNMHTNALIMLHTLENGCGVIQILSKWSIVNLSVLVDVTFQKIGENRVVPWLIGTLDS